MKLEYYPWDCPPDFAASLASRVRNTDPFPNIFEDIQEITINISDEYRFIEDHLWVVDGIARVNRRDLYQERLLIVTPNMINPGGEALAYFAEYMYSGLQFKDEGVVFVRPVAVREGETMEDTVGRELDPSIGLCIAATGLAMTYDVPLDCRDRVCFMHRPAEGESWDEAAYHFCPMHARTLIENADAYRLA
jgi:hypothetical protein